jgi:hypothetical protein
MANTPRLILTHERMAHVFGFLFNYACTYPKLCEGDKAMYRDLCRAALLAIGDEQKADAVLARFKEEALADLERAAGEEGSQEAKKAFQDMLIADPVDRLVWRAAKGDVAKAVLDMLRRKGLHLTVREGRLLLGPRAMASERMQEVVARHREGLIECLAREWQDSLKERGHGNASQL